MEVIQETGSVSFVAILFDLRRKTHFHTFEKCYDQCFLNFANRMEIKKTAFSSFSQKKKKQQLHFISFSQNMIPIERKNSLLSFQENPHVRRNEKADG